MRWRRTRHAQLVNTLNAKLNPICHLLALLGAHRILHVSSIRVKDDCLMRSDVKQWFVVSAKNIHATIDTLKSCSFKNT